MTQALATGFGPCPARVAIWPPNYSSLSNQLPGDQSLRLFTLRSQVAFALSSAGDVYTWGSLTSNKEGDSLTFLEAIPRPVAGLKGKRILSLSCNNKVAVCVSAEGLLYSFGDDAKARSGILGLGETYYQAFPSPIQTLAGHRVAQASVGKSHVAALTARGEVFLWGAGSGVQRKSNVPTELREKVAGKQVVSARNGTVVVMGDGSVCVLGSIKRFDYVNPTREAVSNESAKLQAVKGLTGEFVNFATIGENFIGCLGSKVFADGVGDGGVLWVDSGLRAHKLSADYEVKDILGLVDRIYGLSKDGKYLYEWFPTLSSDKDNRLPATKLRSARNVYELTDPSVRYSGFCDLTRGSFAAMYFSETRPGDGLAVERSSAKNVMFDEIRGQLGDGQVFGECSGDRRGKYREMLGSSRQRLSIDVSNPREESARRIFEEVYRLNRRNNALRGCDNSAKEDFKAGVGAFKHYIKAKRGLAEPFAQPAVQTSAKETFTIPIISVPAAKVEVESVEVPREDSKGVSAQKEAINEILAKIKSIKGKKEMKEEHKKAEKMDKLDILLRRTLSAERIYDFLALITKRNVSTGFKQIVRYVEKDELCGLIKKEMTERKRQKTLSKFLGICRKQMVLKALEDLLGDTVSKEVRRKRKQFLTATHTLCHSLLRHYLNKWRKNAKKCSRRQAGAKEIMEVLKGRANDWLQRLLHEAATIKAKKEIEKLQDELKRQTESQRERMNRTNTTLQELQESMNKLAHCNTASRKISLKHLIGTLMVPYKRIARDNFKAFRASVPKSASRGVKDELEHSEHSGELENEWERHYVARKKSQEVPLSEDYLKKNKGLHGTGSQLQQLRREPVEEAKKGTFKEQPRDVPQNIHEAPNKNVSAKDNEDDYQKNQPKIKSGVTTEARREPAINPAIKNKEEEKQTSGDKIKYSTAKSEPKSTKEVTKERSSKESLEPSPLNTNEVHNIPEQDFAKDKKEAFVEDKKGTFAEEKKGTGTMKGKSEPSDAQASSERREDSDGPRYVERMEDREVSEHNRERTVAPRSSEKEVLPEDDDKKKRKPLEDTERKREVPEDRVPKTKKSEASETSQKKPMQSEQELRRNKEERASPSKREDQNIRSVRSEDYSKKEEPRARDTVPAKNALSQEDYKETCKESPERKSSTGKPMSESLMYPREELKRSVKSDLNPTIEHKDSSKATHEINQTAPEEKRHSDSSHRESAKNPLHSVNEPLDTMKNMSIKESLDATRIVSRAIKRKLRNYFASIRTAAVAEPSLESKSVLPSKELMQKQAKLSAQLIDNLLKRKLNSFMKAIKAHADSKETLVQSEDPVLQKMQAEKNKARGAKMIKQLLSNKMRNLVDGLNSSVLISALQREKALEDKRKAVSSQDIESIERPVKGSDVCDELVFERAANNPAKGVRPDSANAALQGEMHPVLKEDFSELAGMRDTEAHELKDYYPEEVVIQDPDESLSKGKDAQKINEQGVKPSEKLHAENYKSNTYAVDYESGLQISALPPVNASTHDQEERIIPYNIRKEMDAASLKSATQASQPHIPAYHRANPLNTQQPLDYYNEAPISITAADDNRRSSLLDRFFLRPSDVLIKEELGEDDSPVDHLARNTSGISPIKPASGGEGRTPKNAEELKEAYASALNTPDNQLIGKGRMEESEDNSDVGMAEPIELEAFLMPLKDRIPVVKTTVGRYDHKCFIESFTKCFVKYHTQMAEEERRSNPSAAGKHERPASKRRKLPGKDSGEFGRRGRTGAPGESGKQVSIPHVMEYDISQEFRTRLKKPYPASKFGAKNPDALNRSKANNSSLRPPISSHHKKNSGSLSINPLDRSSRSSLANAAGDKSSADYIEMNKRFIKELSSLNREINSKYNCMAQVPRLKVKNPELVLQMVKYKTQLQDISRTSISPNPSPLSKKNDDRMSSIGFQYATRRPSNN